MHPHDARERGLEDGDAVKVFNERGAFVATVRITSDVMARVVQIATGAWFDPLDPSTPGSLEKHGNPNVVTSGRSTSRLAQASASQTVLVQVERCETPPPVTAFDLPNILEPFSAEVAAGGNPL
jgi:biotin/methionine sulfoxide reductase